MDFLSPWSLAGLGLVPAIFLWGLLAPRGRPILVGSLVLWRRALGSSAAGRPSAGARLRDPLLWLDAALVLFLVLACAQPALRTTAPAEPVATVVIDRTASLLLASPDLPTDRRWLDNWEGGRRLLESFDRAPVRVVSVPGPSGAIESATATCAEIATDKDRWWQPVLAAGDVWPAALAEATEHTDRPVVVFTDVAPTVKLPANVYVVAKGGTSANVGLVRVASRLEGGKAWLLVAGRSSPTAVDELWGYRVSGKTGVLLEKYSFVGRGKTFEDIVPLPSPLPATLQVSLVSPGMLPQPPDGVFPWDDAAYLVLQNTPRRTILMLGEAPPALRRALAVQPNTRVIESAAGAAMPAEPVDLVVACGVPLPRDWRGPAVVVAPAQAVGPVEPLDGEAPAERLYVLDGHPLASALYLEPPAISKVRHYRLGAGADILADTTEYPLIVTWEQEKARRLAVLFSLDAASTDWPRRASFPVFWLHAVDWLAPAAARATEYATCRPLAAVPGRAQPAPAAPGFHDDLGVSFIGTEAPFQAGPGCDDSVAAAAAIHAAENARLRAAHTDLWPLLAALALVGVVIRAHVSR
jgi:hypothetical protein